QHPPTGRHVRHQCSPGGAGGPTRTSAHLPPRPLPPSPQRTRNWGQAVAPRQRARGAAPPAVSGSPDSIRARAPAAPAAPRGTGAAAPRRAAPRHVPAQQIPAGGGGCGGWRRPAAGRAKAAHGRRPGHRRRPGGGCRRGGERADER
ncbi:hypothetical protein BU14_1749s0002, partial [Porphyra umbilicalis]